jgi:hypothetical protein
LGKRALDKFKSLKKMGDILIHYSSFWDFLSVGRSYRQCPSFSISCWSGVEHKETSPNLGG